MARGRKPRSLFLVLGLVVAFIWKDRYAGAENDEYLSAVGDPGMRRDGLRLAIEAWNQCNEVGEEVPHMRSPRTADCFDIYKASQFKVGKIFFSSSLLLSFILPMGYNFSQFRENS